MAAERLSRKLIRMLPSDSVFPVKLLHAELAAHYIPDALPPADVAGTLFREPQDDTWRQAHHAAIQSVRTRAWMTYRAFFSSSFRKER